MPRFFRRGISLIDFLPAVADLAAPTSIEITAGEALSPDIAEINGFQLSNSPITTPNLQDQFTPQIDGEDTAPDSSLVFYDTSASSPVIRPVLAKGTAGFLLFRPYGAGTGKRAEVWPVKSTGVNDEWTVGNDAARFAVGFAITAVPEQEAVLP